MRKATLELVPSKEMVDSLNRYETVQEFEILELLYLNYENGMSIRVVRFRFIPGKTMSSLVPAENLKILEVVEDRGDEAVCIIKTSDSAGFEGLAKRFDLGLMSARPMILSRDKLVFSFIGEEESIRKMVDRATFFGKITKVSIQEASFTASDLLHSLTDRQRELLIEAGRMGYYNYPRNADAEDVARSVGLSVSTVVEHLRKAEKKIMNQILCSQ